MFFSTLEKADTLQWIVPLWHSAIGDVSGWIGISLILLAYLFITTHKLDRTSPAYHLLNLLGSSILIYDAYTRGATAFLVLNIAWAGIAFIALLNGKKDKKKKNLM